ncbi:elongation factor EF-3 [Puccinia graminis f. sp. tritici CRL 75-36-700-3]|uniref:Elongation factor EF-3 n=1 Tax=Puccinia graminis f. sp. tritici (strain CRL 75-36-700-3 / race SCCL) TaxID=418459 RepID=E3KJZ4_PUCGT|nr:elongation factor EF-3 [Puccinia graminis f. sp. tritici CRL 75-36-700-3]EFP84619.2 elongation factor EF-3 [Puccinia graminis f. sp. tritici CRL 75-36-700-3]
MDYLKSLETCTYILASHSSGFFNTMRTLSGGQNVRVILAAATWRRPHDVVILDEPTDHSDRESLLALIESLKTFEGGVLVITHNREFSGSICSEFWAMIDGYQEASGHNWTEGQGRRRRALECFGEQDRSSE